MNNALTQFLADPTPTGAVDVALSAHVQFCQRRRIQPCKTYLDSLHEVKNIIAANAEHNRSTGGK